MRLLCGFMKTNIDILVFLSFPSSYLSPFRDLRSLFKILHMNKQILSCKLTFKWVFVGSSRCEKRISILHDDFMTCKIDVRSETRFDRSRTPHRIYIKNDIQLSCRYWICTPRTTEKRKLNFHDHSKRTFVESFDFIQIFATFFDDLKEIVGDRIVSSVNS